MSRILDREELLALRAILENIGTKARENNVRIVIDAEQTWYQPLIDSLTDELMQKYNTLDGPATCIASFQAYLRREPQLLVKQVRGAYMVTEAARWKREGRQGLRPVWPTVEETHASYNYGTQRTISTIAEQVENNGHPKIGAVFATHNFISIHLAIKLLEQHGMAKRVDGKRLVFSNEIAGSIAFAQLYGSDTFLALECYP
ncbi:FAD-linked oxidoreductase-like protein [Aspergillus foveolatus]|uniref:FAD-linked oxidoreductase-like protein n=1 Tax=Aspergillus foveolatus TaxID=210207 RepID=UPI003CCCC810